MNIYFVCTGNTCRSPMAEAILKHQNKEHVVVKSAGIYAAVGAPMSQHAQAVLDEHGIEHQHTATAISEADIEWADVILTMTAAHKAMIVQTFVSAEKKTHTLMEYATNQPFDITDPYGGDVNIYKATYEQLAQLIGLLPLEKEGNT